MMKRNPSHQYLLTQSVKQLTVWLLALLFTLPAYAEDEPSAPYAEDEPSAPYAEDEPSAPTAPAPAQLNPITQAFAQAGVQRCLGRVEQITAFLTGNSSASAGFLFVPPAQQNNSMISTSMEIVSDKASSYASASYHPRQTADNCGGLYETVTYWPSSCINLASTQYAALPKAETLQANIAMLDGGPNMRIFLMSAGAGCVAIKKEVIY